MQNAVFIDAYRRESVRLHRRDLQRQQSTLDALVQGRGTDPAFAAEAREVLGIGAEMTVACVVAPYDGSLDEPLTPPAERLGRHGIISHWHVRGGVSFGAAGRRAARGRRAGRRCSGPMRSAGSGSPRRTDGVAGFATAFQLASRAADTVPREERRVVAVSQRLPEVLLGREPGGDRAARAGDGRADPGPAAARGRGADARPWPRCSQHNGSAKHAAESLFCHRNTVIYRTRQIEQLTGRRLGDARDRMLLGLGLLARN